MGRPSSTSSSPGAPLVVHVAPRRLAAGRARYAVTELLDTIGFCWRFAEEPVDAAARERCVTLYFGPRDGAPAADILIPELGSEVDDAALLALGGEQETPPTDGVGPLVWPHDLVSTAFYLLSRREELDEPGRDSMQRFDAGQSRLHRLGLADRPILNRSIGRLAQAIRSVATARRVPALRVAPWPHPHRWAASLSHDIDDLGYRDARFGLRCLGTFLRTGERYALRKGAGTLLQWGRNRISGERYARWFLDEWLRLEADAGFRSTFFFVSADERKHRRDPNYDITEERLATTLRRMADDGWEVGVHGSFDSYRSAELTRAEKRRLEEVVGREVRGIRQHYLRFDFPQTWTHHEGAGYAYDGTLGFRERLGFRAGISTPFHPYDPTSERRFELLELPLTMMDGVVFLRHGYDAAGAGEAIRSYSARVAGVQGLATYLWHQHTFDERARPGWWNAYGEIVELLKKDPDVWVATMEQAADWWSARAALSVESYESDEPGRARIVLRAGRDLPAPVGIDLGGGWRVAELSNGVSAEHPGAGATAIVLSGLERDGTVTLGLSRA